MNLIMTGKIWNFFQYSMKVMYKYVLVIALAGIFASCQDPSPTELIVEDAINDDNIELELISPEPDEYFYENGYDSTGITNTVMPYDNIISISGIKNTKGNTTLHQGYYLAIFNERSRRFQNNSGRLIGFGTQILGSVSFNNRPALVLPYRLNYIERGTVRDTLLGFQHVLLTGKELSNSAQLFPYGSNVEFRLKPYIGQAIQFEIPTPPEITGNVSISGSRTAGNLRIQLQWKALNKGKIEIIIGGMKNSPGGTFPFFRISTADDGQLNIPEYMTDSLPFERTNILVVTFIRRYRTIPPDHGNFSNNNYVISQSIHNIRIDVP